MELNRFGITLHPGEKRQAACMVPGTDITLHCTLICGGKPGKTVAVTAGIHGAEYASILAAMELAETIRPEELCGNLIILPVANPDGFREKCEAIVPGDGKNLNRVFPGDAAGTVSQKLAHFITVNIQDGADFYLDLHGGDLHERVTPYVYIPGKAAPPVTAAAREAAQHLTVQYRVLSSAETGAYNSAAIRGIPSLLIERGGQGIWSADEVRAYTDDVRRVLAGLGLLAGSGAVNRVQRELTQAFYPCAQEAGFWFPAVNPGDWVAKGQCAGVIRGADGQELQSLIIKQEGVVLYQTTSLAIKKGDILVAYGCE